MLSLTPSFRSHINRTTLATIAALVLAAVAVEAQTQWQRISFGLNDAAIHALVLNDEETPFAATLDGIIRIDSASMTGVFVSPIASHALFTLGDGTMISIGDGVQRSSDDGMTWTRLSDARTDGVVAAASDGTMYRLADGRLSRSVDTARTWQLLDTVYPASPRRVTVLRNGDLLLTSSLGLWRSADKGTTWTQLSFESPSNIVETASGSLAGIMAGRAARSTDGGVTWTAVADLRFRWIGSGRDGTLVGIENDAVEWSRQGTYISTNDGGTWTHMFAARPDYLAVASRTSFWWVHGNRVYHHDGSAKPHTRVRLEPHEYHGAVTDISVDPEGTIYAATPSIVHTGWYETVRHSALSRSTDNGGSWTFLRDSVAGGIIAPFRETVFLRRSRVDAFPDRADQLHTGMSRSTDGGHRWASVIGSPQDVSSRPDGIVAVTALPINTFEAYTFVGPMLVSTDSGRTFQAAGIEDYWRSVLVTRTGTIVAGAMASGGAAGTREAAHLRSTDGGSTFTRSTDSLVFTELSEGRDGTLFGVGCTLSADGRGFFKSSFASIHRSTDDGATWMSVLDSVGYSFAKSAFVYSQSGVILAHVDYRSFRSSDDGFSWSEISVGEYRYPHSIHLDSTDAFLISAGNRIHRSTDGGVTWSVLSDGNPSGAYSKVIVASDGALIVATSDNGLWRSDGPASITARPDAERVTLRITPNPLSTRGTMSVTLARRAGVHASLYDALGRRVARVYEGELAAGTHALPVDVSSLSVGAYLLHVRGDDMSASRLIVVE